MQRRGVVKRALPWTLVLGVFLVLGRTTLAPSWLALWTRPSVDAAERGPVTRSEEASTSKWFKTPWTTRKPDLGPWTGSSRAKQTATHFVHPAAVGQTLSVTNGRFLLLGLSIVVCTAILHMARAAFGGHWHHHAMGCGCSALHFISEPGRPDALFGSLCLFSNVFFAALVPFFWINRRVIEVVWIALVTLASTIYHGFQLHPFHGPLNHTTRCACAGDVALSVSFGLYLACRYKGRRKEAAPVAALALLCFAIPSMLPGGRIAEVAYSLLHSAWHGLAAAAAYLTCSGSTTMSSARRGRGLAKVGVLLMNKAAHTRLPIR
eukprot:Skav204906  [mRNA]  locus=scaffold1926:305936:331098:+ [translate_table: standard]